MSVQYSWQHVCRSHVLQGTPRIAATIGIVRPADLAGNLMATGMTMRIREERGLDRGQVALLEAGLGSMTGNHGNSAACCTQGC